MASVVSSTLAARRRLIRVVRENRYRMKPQTPDQYLASLPVDRRAAMLAIHAAIRKAAPELASEIMTGWVLRPLSVTASITISLLAAAKAIGS